MAIRRGRRVRCRGVGERHNISAIALATPHLQGYGFDLPAVAPCFEEYVSRLGVAGRLSFVPGDFFLQELPRADVVLMGPILQDWDLPTKKMLIAKAFEALPSGGALIVDTKGGFDYTGADCCGWMQEAGFRQTRVEALLGPDAMVIGLK